MSMVKAVILHHLPDQNDLPLLERWFWKHHCPEVLFQAPWLARYVLYRPVPPPPGGDRFGYVNYRVHENWVRSAEERRGTNGMMSMTPQPGYMDVVVAHVPAEPSEDFMGADMIYGEKTILRWLSVFKYPEGVSAEEGDDWYLKVHAPEVMQQAGLIRFFSHKALPGGLARPGQDQKVPLPHSSKLKPFFNVGPLFFQQWHRVSEIWYENNNGWVKSNLESPPAYTKPPWAKYDEYPFLEPWKDFVSTFLLERPDQDMLRDYQYQYV
jgi:hypothetical protein